MKRAVKVVFIGNVSVKRRLDVINIFSFSSVSIRVRRALVVRIVDSLSSGGSSSFRCLSWRASDRWLDRRAVRGTRLVTHLVDWGRSILSAHGRRNARSTDR